ncbi:MAG TPA: hypothetical protein VNK04_23565 [Gemmataceae bacterium]|nr:hypothetical protein [Gemmataceae bacterium]
MAKNRNAKANGKPKRTKKPRPTYRATYQSIVHAGTKSIEELAREQGVELRPWTEEDFKRMIELGKKLFRSHKEREEFFAGIAERRRQNRGK